MVTAADAQDCLSNICIPQSFLGREKPTYPTGLITVACCQGAFFLLNLAFWAITRFENRRRDQLALGDPSYLSDVGIETADGVEEVGDVTDKNNHRFRYYA